MAVGWWIGFIGDVQRLPISSNDLTLADPTETPELPTDGESSDKGVVTPETQPKSVAKSIVKVPQGESKSLSSELNDDLADISPKNFEGFSQRNLDAALSGDLYAGIRLAVTVRECQDTPSIREELDAFLENLSSKMQSLQESNPHRNFDLDKELHNQRIQKFERCRERATFFNDDLRTKLDKLAQEGHVIARYLYSTWPPNYKDDPHAFWVLQEWSLKANEYSFLNVEQGEPAGFLAFGKAYIFGELFTKRDRDLGNSFYAAAYYCGHRDPMLEPKWIENIDNQQLPEPELRDAYRMLEMVNSLSEYCHNAAPH